MNAATNKSPRQWFALISFIFTLLLGTSVVSAQSTPTPITTGQNQTGTLADAPVRYSLSIDAPQIIHVQVLGITSGFAPGFRVLDLNGVLLAETSNDTGVSIVESSAALSAPGSYILEVSSVNNTPGNFLISVQPGDPFLPPEQLVLGELQNGVIDSETTRQAYSFSAASTDVLLVTVQSEDETSGVVVALRDAATSELFALSNAQLGGVRYRILTGTTTYLLEVTFPGSDPPRPYSVCLETENGAVTCSRDETRVQPALPTITPVTVPQTTASPTPNPNGACTVQSASAASVNVRSGPGTGFGVVTQLPLGSTAPVIGRLSDSSWFQVTVGSVLGWVSAAVVVQSGSCTGVSVVPAPALPTVVPASQQAQVTPTMGATMMMSATPTMPTSTAQPSATATEPGLPPTLPVFEPVESRPDLSLTFVGVSTNSTNGIPDAVYPYSISVIISNLGSSSSGPFTFRMCRTDACFDFSYAGLAAGADEYFVQPLSAAPEGMSVFYAFAVDFQNDVDEADETNNLLQQELYFPPL